jgi:hypothetical protein
MKNVNHFCTYTSNPIESFSRELTKLQCTDYINDSKYIFSIDHFLRIWRIHFLVVINFCQKHFRDLIIFLLLHGSIQNYAIQKKSRMCRSTYNVCMSNKKLIICGLVFPDIILEFEMTVIGESTPVIFASD